MCINNKGRATWGQQPHWQMHESFKSHELSYLKFKAGIGLIHYNIFLLTFRFILFNEQTNLNQHSVQKKKKKML